MNVKQVHVRVEDELYEKLNSYSAATDQTIQDCVREAVACYVTDMRKKQREVINKQFTFIDLFAGIGGMRIAFDRSDESGGAGRYSDQRFQLQ